MKEKKALVIILAVFLLLLACAGVLYSRLSEKAAPQQMPAEEGETQELSLAPDITLYDADGSTVQLSDFRGKPVVLNFWASWCPPCKGEMPDFHAAWEERGDEVHFLMVNLTDGSRETVETAAAYVAEQGYEFPVYFDKDQQAYTDYGVYSIPSTLFIDPEGYAVDGVTGAIGMETLNEGISLITE